MTLPSEHMTPQELTWFRRIYDLYYESIRNFAYFKTGDASFSDDVVQDTFVKFWEYRGKVRPETIKALLYTIASNIIKNEFKHNQVVYRFERNQSQSGEFEAADHAILSEEFNTMLQNAIASIPESARIVFLMSRIEGLTYNEIATRLGLSVKAIEKRMSEALAVLRTKIDYKL